MKIENRNPIISSQNFKEQVRKTQPLISIMEALKWVKGTDNQKKYWTESSVFLLSLILGNVKVAQFVNIPVFVGRNNSKPVPHIVFLQVLFGQVL